MAEEFTERQRRGLAALCDTFVAPVRPPRARADDPTGFFGRRASDLDVPARVAHHLSGTLTPEELDDTRRLLDLVDRTGFRHLPQAAREATVAALRRTSGDTDEGLAGLAALTALYFYGSVGAGGTNPNWHETGYPGPPVVDVPARSVEPFVPEAPSGELTLEADAVVVGSGSGGGVVAATLAEAGRDVLVLEAGPYVDESSMPTSDAEGFAATYWRGGLQLSADRNLAVLAGATLGGGSTINWQNCVRPPERVRTTWADAHGMKDVDGPDFDADLDVVAARIGITTSCSDHNGPNQRLLDGAAALGWSAHVASRNVDAQRYDPAAAGHVAFGDPAGGKQGSLRTWLPDAAAAGARIMVDTRATRVVTSAGRATGVEAVATIDGRPVTVLVRSPCVVVACGALETPALLLRSGIGGPAVGRHLRVHPAIGVLAAYGDRQDPWWGAPMTAVVDEFADVVDGHGYLVEAGHSHPGLAAASFPWTSARQHKLVMGRGDRLAGSVAVIRDHGSGAVAIDRDGEAVVTWPADDPIDRRLVHHAVGTLIRLHAAAGATAVFEYALPRPVWRRGQGTEPAARAARRVPLGRGGRVPFCAHQMGSARLGTRTDTSVADPEGQLHDADGVWIGDTSAFPTAVGANPMWTCMALARRTARAILSQ